MSAFDIYCALDGTLDGHISCNEKMAHHVTYHIGGPAALFIECDSIPDISKVLNALREEGLEWIVIGKGSNLLVADGGYGGAVITLGGDFGRIDVDEEQMAITAGAAVPLSSVVQAAYKAELSGFEFAVGIPGTVGGAVAGNVGTRDDWIGKRVTALTVYDPVQGLRRIIGAEVPWQYRRSALPGDLIILETGFLLSAGSRDVIRARMEGSRQRRRQTQPLDMPSAGSIFKNPKGHSAGRLIESAGLKGAKIGGAQISEVHANFIVNREGATAQDVVDLIVLARDRVREVHGIELKPEVRFLGFEE